MGNNCFLWKNQVHILLVVINILSIYIFYEVLKGGLKGWCAIFFLDVLKGDDQFDFMIMNAMGFNLILFGLYNNLFELPLTLLCSL